jgi:hypothetical protein
MVAGGIMAFTGPAHLLERPTDDEIRARIAATEWRSEFRLQFVRTSHRLGYIETFFQLDYLCTESGIGADLSSYGQRVGVRMVSHPKPRGRRLHR